MEDFLQSFEVSGNGEISGKQFVKVEQNKLSRFNLEYNVDLASVPNVNITLY